MGKLDLTKLGAKKDDKPAATNESIPAGGSAKPPAGLAFLKNRKESASVPPAEKPASTPAATGSGGGLAFLKQRAATQAGSGGSSSDADKKPDANGLKPSDSDGNRDSAGKADATSRVGGGGSVELADLMDSVSESGSSKSVTSSRFHDEIPATGPVRELPEDISKGMANFAQSLDTVYKVIHEPEMLGNVVKSIMSELASNPEYRKLIQPMDMHVMIKGMRDSMGMARIKKEEAKAKRSGGASKKKTKVDDIDVLAALDELGDFS